MIYQNKIFIKYTFLLLVALFLTSFSKAQYHIFGTPQIINFSKSFYNADSKNWSITQDGKGVLYFANGNGLLSFDGAKWNLDKLPESQVVRAVAHGDNNKIYTGGFGEFGYWQINKTQPLQYFSLNHLIENSLFEKEEIWKIVPTADGIFLQSFSQLYRFQNNKISSVKLPGNIMMLFSIKGKEYIQVLEKGLFLVNIDNSVTKISGSDIFNDKKIISIVPFINNTLLIGTVKNGFYIYDGFSFKEWNTPANIFIKKNDLNAGIQLEDNRYVFGSIQNGLIVCDAQGNIIHQINRSNGLQNNTVLFLYKDMAGNIVAALDNGIDYIVINSPLTFYKDNGGNIGATYTALLNKENFYIGSNQGLFHAAVRNFNPFEFSSLQKIKNIYEQVWNLSYVDGSIFCGNNNATYNINGNAASQISEVPGGWTLQPLKKNPDYLIQGSYIGLAMYAKNDAGNWQFEKLLDSTNNIPAKTVIQDSIGNIWIQHVNKGVYQTTIEKDLHLRPLQSVQTENKEMGKSSFYKLFSFNETPILFNETGFYSYDYSSKKFISDKEINKKMSNYSHALNFIDDSLYCWAISNNHTIVMMDKITNDKQTISWKQANFSMVNASENILKLNDNLYLICGEDGFIIFDKYFSNPIRNTPVFFINKINIWENGNYTFDSLAIEEGKFKYKNNGIVIEAAYPVFDKDVEYRYSLSENKEVVQWTEWSSNSEKEYSNLNPGKYFVKIQNNQTEEILVYSFTILNPWYKSVVAYIVYFFSLIFLGFFVYLYIRKRIEKQNMYLKLQHERKLLEERRRYEHLVLIRHQEELEKEVIIKNENVAKSAMKLIKNKKSLQKLKGDLNKMKKENANDVSNFQIQKLSKQLDRLIEDDQEERNLFENGFSKVHEEFFRRLLTDFPHLTSQDLKLAAYLKMNLSSKEIAPLLDISVRGVEIKRYRFRKKLNLESDENLNDFMMKYQ